MPCCGLCNSTKGDRFTVIEMQKLGKLISKIKKERHGKTISDSKGFK